MGSRTETLELYFQICSLLSTSKAMSIMASTLANGGECSPALTGGLVRAGSGWFGLFCCVFGGPGFGSTLTKLTGYTCGGMSLTIHLVVRCRLLQLQHIVLHD